MSTRLKRILLVDDSPRDTELALDALARHNLANEVVAVRDGAEALDYLYRRGQFADRASGQPAVVLLDLKMPEVDGLDGLRAVAGVWAVAESHHLARPVRIAEVADGTVSAAQEPVNAALGLGAPGGERP